MAGPRRPETPRRPGWGLALAVAVLLGAGAWLVTVRSRAPTAATAPPPFAPPQMPNTQYESRIRSLDAITGATDPHSMSGYRVEIANVPVVAVAGRAFWIADQQGRRIMVLPNNPNTPMDAVQAGRTVSITGAVTRPEAQDELAKELHLDAATAAKLASQPVFLRADSIRPGA